MTSDAKPFWKRLVVVVFGPSLKKVRFATFREGAWNEFRNLCTVFTSTHFLWFGLPEPLLTLPKGPFRTKNATTIAKKSDLLRRSVFTTPPYLLRRGPFLERNNACNSQENGIHTSCTAIANQCVSKFTTRSQFTTGSIFSTAGHLGRKRKRR